MRFWDNPMLTNHILEQQGVLDDVYRALNDMDMAEAVLAALKVLRITGIVPLIMRTEKNSQQSCIYRIEGNTLYAEQRYQLALVCYNKALLFAPKGSIELLQAYSNRSALLLKLKAYSASLNDIETCFKLECTGDLLKKLKKRREECFNLMWKENFKTDLITGGFPAEFFKLNGKRHPDVPCLSADVDIVRESGEQKIVAEKDIKVGSLIAIETAFVTHSGHDKMNTSCYYCQKMTYNLTPCNGCCIALFCSEKCKDLCLNEYHHIECHIMDALDTVHASFKFRLAIKTVLKLKTLCKQWSTLIKESKSIGTSRLKACSVKEVYDVDNYSSMLSFKESRQFVHGAIYNSCFVYATVIHHLENISGFFPVSPVERLEAKKCLAKLFMTLELMWPYTTEIENAAELADRKIVIDVPVHFGWFAFTGKLKHSCEPNVIVLGLDNRVGLVAVKPIKKKTELKISYVGYWYDHMYNEKRAKKLYQATLNVCTCRVCKESWDVENFYKSELNHTQQRVFSVWDNMRRTLELPQLDRLFFKETCKAMAILEDHVNTREHCMLFRELRDQLGLCQFAASQNNMIN